MEPGRKKDSFQPAQNAAPKKKEGAASKESFTYFAPTADNVMLVGDFTEWEQNPIALKKQKDGTWKLKQKLTAEEAGVNPADSTGPKPGGSEKTPATPDAKKVD